MSEVHPQAAKVTAAAAAADVTITPVEFPESTRTAQQAADALECDVEQIVKSLIFQIDHAESGDEAGADEAGTSEADSSKADSSKAPTSEIVLALTSGKNTVDTDRLAQAAGGQRCGRANPDQVRATTGYAIGGVPPIGHDHAVRTWIDPHLLTLPTVWAAAGTPRHVFEIEPDVLVAISGAVVFDFT